MYEEGISSSLMQQTDFLKKSAWQSAGFSTVYSFAGCSSSAESVLTK